MKNTKTSEKIVTIKILDHTGDSSLQEKIDAAVQKVAEQHFKFGKWPYVGTRYFQFTAKDLNDAAGLLKDTIELKKLLEESEEPIVVLTGDLQGGNR
jgi:hypothetical protein